MARLAAIFFATGFVSATWAARIPAVKDRLGLGNADLGLAVLAIEAGAIVGLPVGAALVRRAGSRRSLSLAFAVFPGLLLAAVLAPRLPTLAACLAAWACANSVIDVALNVQGAELERRRRRPLLTGLHAWHSFGLVGGGAAATAAAAAGLGLSAHVAVVAIATTPGALAAGKGLAPDSAEGDGPHPGRVAARAPSCGAGRTRPRGARGAFARPRGALLKLGLLAFAAAMADGAASNWSAVHLRVVHHARPGLAAAGFTCFAVAVTLGRLAAHRVLKRFGRVSVVRAGGVIATAGAVLVVAAPGPVGALAAWALVGAGLSAVMPTALAAAPGASAAAPGVAIASVSTIGYLGSFTGPPLIGFVAGFAGLPAALCVLVAAAALVALCAPAALRGAGRGR